MKPVKNPSNGVVAAPFDNFYQPLGQSPLRQRITASCRTPEPEAVQALLPLARSSAGQSSTTQTLARKLALGLRNENPALGRAGLVQGLLREFALSSQEGVALMCLAEALLRIPDAATRDALIRDKIGHGDWQAHIGQSPSLFVNAAAWGLLLTGRLVGTHSEAGLGAALKRVASRSGEPLIRKGVDLAMRMMGEQFVTGETIAQALANAQAREARGFRFSYDMLGEAALTASDAERYFKAYEEAIEAIGQASAGRGIYEGPGISIKLSALHPRYSRAQAPRVMAELYPRLLQLAELAKHYDIGINIDAEEAERLALSLDLLERLCFAPTLAGWNGIGFVIQAYQKRCPAVVGWLIDLARRSQHRLMIRLVKGAYWDSEIKRAQVDGLADFPVYTRKAHTDLAFLACARQLLAAPGQIYPQFATHNAHTLAAVHAMAGQNYYAGQYEFQCLHGMGEPLYEQVVGSPQAGKLGRPCRVYAPVGTHETLLAYLVRRLLENGANTSFVNRMADASLPIDALIQDPLEAIEQTAAAEGAAGLPHPAIALPRALFGPERANSAGLDLNDETALQALRDALQASASASWAAAPTTQAQTQAAPNNAAPRPILNPANTHDIVGTVTDATLADVQLALQKAEAQSSAWATTAPAQRAATLEKSADLMQTDLPRLAALMVREAGKTTANAIAEVREAIDFLRYYAAQVRNGFDNTTHLPLGPVVCISPWNFPLAIFTGQVAAVLAAGNVALAKPAEQTPLIAAEAVRLMHEAGVPSAALQLLPGPGETIGAALTASPTVQGVVFTGSTEVARLIQRTLAKRLGEPLGEPRDARGKPVVLIAETGGQNAMIVDSSALLEQVIVDVLASAFDSAGQRCSALRVLCVQDDVADRLITMLEGAMRELQLGNPCELATDVGPVIDAEARRAIERHITMMRAKGHRVTQPQPLEKHHAVNLTEGHFIPPTLIEINNLAELEREVFGPVLHVLRYPRDQLGDVLDQIHATGFGLTLGLHTRIDETVQRVLGHARVGNIYVNRNMVGAVVGVQPFGGDGLSGTGPKAGGPLYLLRLLSQCPRDAAKRHVSQQSTTLPGPTGESNVYSLLPRQAVLCLADSSQALTAQVNAVLAAGSRAVCPAACAQWLAKLTLPQFDNIVLVEDWRKPGVFFDLVLHQGNATSRLAVCQFLAALPGPIVSVEACGDSDGAQSAIALERLYVERSVSINTAAAGGNASLMTVG
jgi:RHH-type transcriptional regulator, proline utilization regulon repressor / proline dehydrogenase / delta 1-pyrroline-5-carboxylate dehydrogenase